MGARTVKENIQSCVLTILNLRCQSSHSFGDVTFEIVGKSLDLWREVGSGYVDYVSSVHGEYLKSCI